MRYLFLDKLAEDGHISQTDRDHIYDTCSHMVTKAASVKEKLPTWGEAFAELGMDILQKFIVPTAIGGAVAGAAAYGLKKYDEHVYTPNMLKKDLEKLLKVKEEILKAPEFSLNRAKASARFDELAKISPAVASKPNAAKRLVADRLHSGFTPEDAQRLIQTQATYERHPLNASTLSDLISSKMPKTASALSPEDQGRLAATITQILGEASFLMNKTAALPWKTTPFQKSTDVAKEILRTGAIVSGFGALMGLGAGAINTAASLVSKQNKAKKLKRSYLEAMRRSDPTTEPLHANKEKSLRAFQTLAHFSPNTASDPEAARAFMLNLVSMNQGAQTSVIKELADIEKNLKQVKPASPFLTGFGAGAQHAGLSHALGSATNSLVNPFVEQGTEQIRSTMGY